MQDTIWLQDEVHSVAHASLLLCMSSHMLFSLQYQLSGTWVGTQRTQYRIYMKAKEAGKAASLNSAMSEDRIAQLDELGFVWALRGVSDTVWRKRVQELEEFRAVHGHTAVPPDYKIHPRLGSWVSMQRAQYRLMQDGKASTLDEEKVAELDSLNFTWDEPSGAASDEIAAADAIEVAGALGGPVDDGDALEPMELVEGTIMNMPMEHAEI